MFKIGSIEYPILNIPDGPLLRVSACGICGTDLHIMSGESYRPELPLVLGHEPVGTVVAQGAQVAAQWVGKQVTMILVTGCGECPYCRRGDERLNPNLLAVSGVLRVWGGYTDPCRTGG